jgi:hypothetical protein
MRSPRFRITVRRMMVAVAIAAVFLLFQTGRYKRRIYESRVHDFVADQYDHYLDHYDTTPGFWMLYNGTGPSGRGKLVVPARRVYKGDPILRLWTAQYKARAEYHRRMAARWSRASWQPWFAVPPDPTPPPVPQWIEYHDIP